MSFIKNNIERVYIIEPKIFEDTREYLFESCDEVEFKKNGILNYFVQDNQSKFCFNVIRGLHCLFDEHSQAKLESVLQDKVLDVVVDIRKRALTFCKHVDVEFPAENHNQLFISRDFHDFSVLTEETIFTYKCENSYYKDAEIGISYDEHEIIIDYKVFSDDIITSEKYLLENRLEDIPNER